MSDLRARGEDLGQVTGRFVSHGGDFGHLGLYVAEVDDVSAQLLHPLREARVTNRARSHVDATPARSEVERGAEDRYPGLACIEIADIHATILA
jgi:hypothetical protein